MDTQSFYKSQREVAEALNLLIDGYWCNKVSEKEFIESIKRIIKNNRTKVFTEEGQFSIILIQKYGKRTLELISKILEMDKERE